LYEHIFNGPDVKSNMSVKMWAIVFCTSYFEAAPL